MKMHDAVLPWNGIPVLASENLYLRLGSAVGEAWAKYLPRHITLFADRSVENSRIESFISSVCSFLPQEMAIRTARVWRLASGSMLSEEELESFLTVSTTVQRWGLYFSEDGGLTGVHEEPTGREGRGLVPCSSMRNHGVGWSGEGPTREIWLATARKPHGKWDLESDIGHESAHAAFAPVPLFVQQPEPEGESLSLANVSSVANMTSKHVARLLYWYTELVVVAIRGEVRHTFTRLPVADPEEMRSLLALSSDLFPGNGFEEATETYSRARGRIDPSESDAIFGIAAPVIRVLPKFMSCVDAVSPPTVEQLRIMLDIQPEPVGSFAY